MDSRPLRLGSGDSTYWFVRRAFGWSVVLQVLWTFDRPPPVDSLADAARCLSAGPLGRRVVRSRVPFGRPRCVHSDRALDLLIDDLPIADDLVEQWAEGDMHSAPLDAELGYSWRLRGARTVGGGFVLSLTALHLIADGKTVVGAAADAFSGVGADSLTGDREGRLRAVLDDVADVVRLGGESLTGIARAVKASRAESPEPVPQRLDRAPIERRSPRASGPWVIVSVDRDEWSKVADHHGGTANSLFVAVVSGLLRSSGYAPKGQPIKVGIPVSNRTASDNAGNATAGVSVYLTDDPDPERGLGSIRRQCKAAFRTLSAGRRPAMTHLLPLMWLLPVRLIVKVVGAGDGMPDAVVSNLGEFGESLLTIGGVRASGVAFRGIAAGVDPHLRYRFGDGVQSWLVQVGDQITFSVAAFDETAFADRADLRRMLGAELDAWGVRYRMW